MDYKLAIIVPTIREESYAKFLDIWKPLFEKHKVQLITVWDGEKPRLNCVSYTGSSISQTTQGIESVMGEYADLIYNFNDGVRNLGFAYVAKNLPEIEYVITFDDDVVPIGDTIEDHLDALNQNVPVSWMNTSMTDYMWGFPYNIRQEAEVWVSHGVWTNVADFDALTQLVKGIRPQVFYKGSIPKGIFYPHCAMNFSFKREALPYVYQAPMGPKIGLDRFGDIWGGIEMKKDLDRLGKAVVSGYAIVEHVRASDVYKNLQKEAKGVELNDFYGKDKYFKLFFAKRKRWKKFILSLK